MSAGDTLRASERSALHNTQIISHVSGKKNSKKKKLLSFSAAGFIIIIVLVFGAIVGIGNIIPDAISTRLIEETDVQYSDAVASKIIVMAEALKSGDLPENTIKRLKDNGIEVQHSDDGAMYLEYDGKVVTGDNLQSVALEDTKLYNAIEKATYSRAAYYYDNSAHDVFSRIGSSRNNYTSDASFDEIMSSTMGKGSDINVNNVALFEWEDEETGEIISEYDEVGETGNSDSAAESFVESVRQKNVAESSKKATMNAADALSVADTIAKEQRSSLFFLNFMENISKMKAGDGNESRINDAMNYLFDPTESTVTDVDTHERITSYGSMTESPSLYSVLSGDRIDVNKVKNYSSERILRSVENQIGVGGADEDTLSGTVTSTNPRVRGSIGRFLELGGAEASGDGLSVATSIVQDSLVDNSFDTIGGIKAGEMLVEGAVNVGKELAKASGATPGSADAVKQYAKLTNTILAMEAKSDRLNRSPFDITSKNTFLGSIVYNLAINIRGSSSLSRMSSLINTTAKSFASILPSALADDEADLYLTNFGECEKIGSIGAVGSAGCSMIATFDTSTLGDIFSDAGFISFMEENTSLSDSGARTINEGSTLAKFIDYNNDRITPIGVTDGGILESLNGGGFGRIPFISDILSMITTWLETSDEERMIASGEAFVNSDSNSDWQTYKYAQRYVSLARATESLRQYDGDNMAYSKIKYFEGTENPVVAYKQTKLARH
ncbi:hypothetical protein IJ101_00270 [Candidatus Saccharibacteria bacterium]|nr:hypothetical protein [Candidatus Saccharibacteria bacterium]